MIPFSAGIFSNGICFYPYDFVSFCSSAPKKAIIMRREKIFTIIFLKRLENYAENRYNRDRVV